MNKTLKAAGHIGAELGAAIAENARLRGLLHGAHDTIRNLAEDLDEEEFQATIGQLADIELALGALSRQAEPVEIAPEEQDRIAIWERHLARKAEPAPAQDEREAFEAHMRLGGYSNPEKHQDGSYVSSAMELWWQGWKARATRPAQTEQQPVAWVEVKDRHEGPYEFHGLELLDSGKHNLYAAPTAQAAPRCQCCGYLVTDSEHRGCLRAATPAMDAKEE
jgi:hypothetical protein